MDDNTLVNSSFSAIVNAPIEKIDIARGISRRGGTSRQFRKGHGGERRLNTARGEANFVPNSLRCRVRL